VAFLYSKSNRRILLSLIIIFGVCAFWIIGQSIWFEFIITLFGLLALILTYFEYTPLFLSIFLSFLVSYSVYELYLQYALPLWLVMIAIFLLFGYIFLYTEQKIGILGNKRLVYLILFSLIILEIFLCLNYFLINSLSKSLIIATINYLFIGFCYTILAKHTDNKFYTYIVVAFSIIAIIFGTSIWGGGV